MKMKKIVALALAGALCLGMSTVAFAADSPQKSDAVQATEEGKEIVVGEVEDPAMSNWNDVAKNDPEKLDKTVKNTFKDQLYELNKQLDDIDPDEIKPSELKKLQEQQKVLESLANDDAVYEVVTIADIAAADGTVVDEEHPLNVRFNLGGLKDLDEGQKIRILHLVDGLWQVYETEVKLDDDGWYAEWAFEHFSPVAVFRVNSDNSVTPEPTPTPNPDEPTVTPDPDVNGSITADQLADLIVKKLQANANATKVVRTSVKASPKTGE